MRSLQKAGALLFDLAVLLLLGIWLAGGIFWNGRWILTHGADPRRAAILLACAGALLVPPLRGGSLVLRAVFFAVRKLESPRVRWCSLALGCAWAVLLGILQALALRFPLYDVGIFHQIGWSLAHGHGFVSTISGAGNFLKDHLSPTLALLVPFFWISGSSPLILPILHPVLIFGGAAAWIYLAERSGEPARRPALAAAATVFILCFDSFWGNFRWGFHENAISFAAISWGFALLYTGGLDPSASGGTRKAFAALVLFGVAALTKEILLADLALGFLVWSHWEFFRNRRRGLAAILLVLALEALVAFAWFEKIPHPADKNYFNRYYSYLGHGLGEFLKTLLTEPWLVVRNVGGPELLRYFIHVFLPWLFLPLAFPVIRDSARWLWILVPSLASAALATYPPLRQTSFHYVLELWPVLATLTVLALSRLGSSRWIWAWAVLAAFLLREDPWNQAREYLSDARESFEVRELLAAIPEQDSVLADELAGTWVAGRLRVARWADLAIFGDQCPDWVVLVESDLGTGFTECRKGSPEWRMHGWVAYRNGRF